MWPEVHDVEDPPRRDRTGAALASAVGSVGAQWSLAGGVFSSLRDQCGYLRVVEAEAGGDRGVKRIGARVRVNLVIIREPVPVTVGRVDT